VGAREGERTLDLCAAPGGKATQLAGEVVAVEIHEARARELQENVRRLGADNVTVVNGDALALPSELTGFDRVLVDAPCSGLGVSSNECALSQLRDQIDALMRAGVRIFLCDVGDGHFVEPVTMGPIVLKSISTQIHDMGGVIDGQLMPDTTENHFKAIKAAGG